jgi:hypothetical protein
MTDNSRILQYLQDLALPEVRGIVERAVTAAFPNGMPQDDDDFELCMDWSKGQEQLLAELFGEFEIYNGTITNKLGQFIEQNKVAVLAPEVTGSDEAGSDEAEGSPQDVDPHSILAELGQLRNPDNLTEIQRNAWLAWQFECGISNGGIWRHFMDSDSLKLTQPHFVGALRHLGAKGHAVILEQAVARMPHGLSMSEAFDLLLEEGDVSDLEDLDATLTGCGSRPVDLLQHYVLQHIDDFTDFVK